MKYYEVKFKIEAPEELRESACDLVSALAGEAGFETFEATADGVVGYVQQSLFDASLLEAQLAGFPLPHCAVTFTVTEAADEDWNAQWELEGFEPIVIPFPSAQGSEVIIHDGRHLPPTPSPDAVLIEIDARMAFGTGTHQTTRLMVRALMERPWHREMTADGQQGLRVLDCGTGTGILAIATLKMGASEAVGYDIDEWSADNARHNAVINRVDDRFTPLLGDAKVLDRVEGKFDVVVANINRNILLADMPVFVEKLKAGGCLIISGFYAADVSMLIDKAGSLGLSVENRTNDSDWECLTFHYSA
jgi:ribosomal protein L11 methyltransferase